MRSASPGSAAAATCCPASPATAGPQAGSKADQYLPTTAGPSVPARAQLSAPQVASDGHGGWTASYTQSYQGVPVFGALLRAHLDSDGSLTAVNGYAAPASTCRSTRACRAAQAGSTAVAWSRPTRPSTTEPADMTRPRGRQHPAGGLPHRRHQGVAGKAVLAYVVEVTNRANVRDVVFIDAQTGKMVNRYSMIDNDLDRELYEQNTEHRRPIWEEGDPFPGDPQRGPAEPGRGHRRVVLVLRRTPSVATPTTTTAPTMKTVNNDPTIACPNANWNGVTTNYCNGVTSDDVVVPRVGPRLHRVHLRPDLPVAVRCAQRVLLRHLGRDHRPDQRPDGRGRGRHRHAARPASLCAERGSSGRPGGHQQPGQHRQGVPAPAPAAFGRDARPRPGSPSDVVVAVDPADTAGPTRQRRLHAADQRCGVAGNFGFVDRGTCAFTVRRRTLVAAGATGIVIGNNAERRSVRTGWHVVPALTCRWSASPGRLRPRSRPPRGRARSTRPCGSPAPRPTADSLPLADRRERPRPSVGRSATCGSRPAPATRAR